MHLQRRRYYAAPSDLLLFLLLCVFSVQGSKNAAKIPYSLSHYNA
jgi:hypothetical protein